MSECGLDLWQVGLDFRQGCLDFQQVGFDFRQGGLNFKQVGLYFRQIENSKIGSKRSAKANSSLELRTQRNQLRSPAGLHAASQLHASNSWTCFRKETSLPSSEDQVI